MRTDCATGVAAPNTPTNTSPLGSTTGPVFVPGGATFKTTVRNWGELGAPGESIRTWP